jgi:tetratricopeptide (TPR) repeat protein
VDRLTLEKHIAPEVLRAFALGHLMVDESHQVSDHLAFCPSCRLAFIETMKTVEIPSNKNPQDFSEVSARYHGIQRIAYGGMGVVYLAIDSLTGAKVAIKQIIPRSSDEYGSDRKERMLREAHALMKLDHPNIVRAIDVILVEDSPTLVMEYVPGQSLHRWIRSHRPDLPMITNVMMSLTDAVFYAHRQGVVHCDLKPQNVIVTGESSSWGFKLIDFGLSKLLDEDWNITLSGDVLGTPAYMAPEQTSGKSILASPAVDVYGLGVILYELLTGHPPFEDSDRSMLLDKVVRQAPERPSRIQPGIPKALERICMACLEKRPEHRYRCVQDLEKDLRAFVQGLPIAAKDPGLVRKLTCFVRANRTVSWVLSATVFLGVAAGAWIWNDSLVRKKLQALIQELASEKERAKKISELAQDAIIKELRVNLQETAERLYGATSVKEDAEWNALDRLMIRWRSYADRIDDSQLSRIVRAEASMRIGSIQTIFGKLASAEENLRSALGVLEEAFADPKAQSQRLSILSESRRQLAKCLFDAGKSDESDVMFQEALKGIEQAIEYSPDDSTFRLLRSKILCDFGTLLTQLSRVQEAQERLQESLEVLVGFDKPLSQSTESVTYKSLSSEASQQRIASINALARVILATGGAAQAVQLLEDSKVELWENETLVPNDPVVQRLISIHRTLLGHGHLILGRFEASKVAFLEAEIYQSKLIDQDPRRPDLQRAQASLMNSMAIVSLRIGQLGDDQGAYYLFAQSQAMYQDLIDRYPSVTSYLSGLISSSFSEAELATERCDFHQALDAYSRIIEIMSNAKPGLLASQANLLSRAYLGQAMVFMALGDFDSSRACAQLGLDAIELGKEIDPQGSEISKRCEMLVFEFQ